MRAADISFAQTGGHPAPSVFWACSFLSYAEHDAGRDTNGIRRAAIRAKAEVLDLLPQSESSACAEHDVSPSACAERESIVRIAHSAEENLREWSEPAPPSIGKARAKRVRSGSQPWCNGSSVIQGEITDSSEPTVDTPRDGAAATVCRDA